MKENGCIIINTISLNKGRNLKCTRFQARVEKHHEVLEIGCGWGTLAMEVVRRTGCKYTGITLSEEQLRYAEQRVKEAGLQV